MSLIYRLHVPYMSPTCPLHVAYMSLTCPLHVPYIAFICPLHVSSCPLHVSYMSLACILCVLCLVNSLETLQTHGSETFTGYTYIHTYIHAGSRGVFAMLKFQDRPECGKIEIY